MKPIIADGVVFAFRHVWPESWGPRLDYILTNAVRALLDVPGGTLLMLPRLLIDDAFRVQLVKEHVANPYVQAFWLGEYAGYGDHFRAEAISPIQNKIGKALIEPKLRNMLAQPKSTITLRRLIDEGAIVICNLAKGRRIRLPYLRDDRPRTFFRRHANPDRVCPAQICGGALPGPGSPPAGPPTGSAQAEPSARRLLDASFELPQRRT